MFKDIDFGEHISANSSICIFFFYWIWYPNGDLEFWLILEMVMYYYLEILVHLEFWLFSLTILIHYEVKNLEHIVRPIIGGSFRYYESFQPKIVTKWGMPHCTMIGKNGYLRFLGVEVGRILSIIITGRVGLNTPPCGIPFSCVSIRELILWKLKFFKGGNIRWTLIDYLSSQRHEFSLVVRVAKSRRLIQHQED